MFVDDVEEEHFKYSRMNYSKENYNLLQNRGMLQINNITTMSSTTNTTQNAYSVTNLLSVKQLKP